MTPGLAGYDHASAVAQILAGYHRIEMAQRPDETSPHALKRQQDGRARDEDRHARDATQPAEQRAHRRRADKAAYLRDKLAEAEQADRAAQPRPN